MPAGLHILAGSPKVGKSWLALWLCHQISNGEKVWEFDTIKCGTLYISLEDTIDRLHFRLSRITDTGSEQAYFATNADNLSGSLIEQLELFMQDYSETGLIVIDTFQRIRDTNSDKSSYSNDYGKINLIKTFADKYKIAVLLVHHLRKTPDKDPFNMVSGSTGIIGAVDSIYVLDKDRTDNMAVLHVTGRDILDMQLLLEFDRDTAVWNFGAYMTEPEQKENKLIPAITAFVSNKNNFAGTATELIEHLHEIDSALDLKPNSLSRTLKEQSQTLESHGIKVSFSRTNSAKLINLSMICDE